MKKTDTKYTEGNLFAAILKAKPTASMPEPGAQPPKPKKRKKRLN